VADHRGGSRKGLTGSGAIEKRGGYSPSGKPVAQLPKVPAGPAPGAPKSDKK
jgi:hypothetical protein